MSFWCMHAPRMSGTSLVQMRYLPVNPQSSNRCDCHQESAPMFDRDSFCCSQMSVVKCITWQCVTLWPTLLFLSSLNLPVSGQKWLTEHFLPHDYNRNEVPLRENINQGLLFVNGTVVLNTFQAADNQMSLNTDLVLCLQWHDYRLRDIDSIDHNGTTNITALGSVRMFQYDHFWFPKVYFRNALSSRTVNTLQSNQYIDLWPHSKMLTLCSRMKIQFMCAFNLSNFPFDAQTCFFELQTFQNSMQNLQIDLKFIEAPTHDYQFRLHHTWNGTCLPSNLDPFTQVAHINTFSCAFVAVRLVRHVNYYIIRYYLTTFLILVICFVQFWIPTIAWPGRLVFTVVVSLILFAVSHTAYDEIPSHDVVALYWWLWVIQFFVYMALIEFATALAWVQFVQDKRRARAANVPSPDGHYFGKKSCYAASGALITKFLYKIFGPIDFQADEHGRNKIDYVARFLFPFMTLIFVLTYIVATVPAWAYKYR